MSTRTREQNVRKLTELIAAHARGGSRALAGRIRVSRADGTSVPEHSITEPMLVILAQGSSRLLLDGHVHELVAGRFLLTGTNLSLMSQVVRASPQAPFLDVTFKLDSHAIAALLLELPATRTAGAVGRRSLSVAVGDADVRLLDAVVRMLQLLEHPDDIPVLAPLVEREILWRLLRGPHGDLVRQIGLVDRDVGHLNQAIQWIRTNYAAPMRIEDLARLAGMSTASFHRHFRVITTMSPLQFQKRIRLQEARALLVAGHGGDIARVAHLVGYGSPSQFSREYRRLFGAPPGQDAARFRVAADSYGEGA
ncbi:AraC-like DNA-binding protein [Saccharothrix coeruleofusca]|uniref:AraC family transcriptional regulator n=1 Tax=Saccharothrix coeruleofusca TaxID=33919 RepID=UPI001AE25E35|nr:AraC family transcriptional regulator [Saccharothrix coeruleofusca]MBP2336041.1 AraC-like DNA-binding protein [Saccharothrix coeruleofusca]